VPQMRAAQPQQRNAKVISCCKQRVVPIRASAQRCAEACTGTPFGESKDRQVYPTSNPSGGTDVIKPGDQKFIEPGELRERMNRGEVLILIDVRSAEEFDSGAINIPADRLTERIGELPSNATIVTVCNFGGARSCGAAEQLQHLGYSSALPLRGGTRGWQAEQG
jgi:rhodanese-related sulfurtransferase